MEQERGRTYETELELGVPAEAVWKALADADEVERWFATDAEIRPGAGGEVRWRWGALHDWPLRIEVWEPGERLRIAYDSAVPDGAGGFRPLSIDFRLEGHGGGTLLRLVHAGFGPEAEFDAEYDGISRGWAVELQSLRLYLERHRGRDRQLVWSVADVGADLDAAWERLAGPEGLRCGAGIVELPQGSPFRIETAAGDVFSGCALRGEPRQFAGVAESHGGGFLRLAVERCGATNQAWLWLGAYGRPPAELEALRARWDAMLRRLFAAQGSGV